MKKIFSLFSVVAFVFASCSSDSGYSTPELTTNGTKLAKAVLKDSNGVIQYTQEYEYIENKLYKVKINDNYFLFFYTGNLMTKGEDYVDNVLRSTSYLVYNSDEKLIEQVILNINGNGYKTTYVYNNDNTVTITQYSGDLITQNNFTASHKAFLVNDVLIKTEKYELNNGFAVTYTNEYTYDDQNNPLYNILGYEKLTFFEVGSTVTPGNLLSITYSQSNSTDISSATTSFSYNLHGFPIVGIENQNSSYQITREYYYYPL